MTSTSSDEAYIVSRYELWRNWSDRYAYKHAKGARIDQIARETGGTVDLALELGVGPGGIAAAMSRRGTRIIGIDLSPDALNLAKRHCDSDNVSLLRASGFSLPFGDRMLKLAYASQVLHLFDRPGRLALLREIHRILQPGGRFIFDMKNIWSHPLRYLRSTPGRKKRNFPSHAEIRELLRDAGFSDAVSRPGLLPMIRWSTVPDIGPFRLLAHTTFFIARVPVRPTSSSH